MLLARIAKIQKKWYLVGANPVHVPMTYTLRMKKILRKNDKGSCPSVKDAAKMLIKQENNPTRPPKPVSKEKVTKYKTPLFMIVF